MWHPCNTLITSHTEEWGIARVVQERMGRPKTLNSPIFR